MRHQSVKKVRNTAAERGRERSTLALGLTCNHVSEGVVQLHAVLLTLLIASDGQGVHASVVANPLGLK